MKRVAAYLTTVRSFSSMNSHMSNRVVFVVKALITVQTVIR